MAWRFKASKYKNAAPIVPKFEQHIRDLVSIGNQYCSEGISKPNEALLVHWRHTWRDL